MPMHNLITLKFGTDKEHINVKSYTKFVRNLISVHSAMKVYSCKKIKFLSWLQGKLLMGITCIYIS